MKFLSWNVNGLRACWNHGLQAVMQSYGADIYALQETKTVEAFAPVVPRGYHAYWSFCTRRGGYSGTLCLTRMKPVGVSYGLEGADFDTEGRIITLEFGGFYFVNCYVPRSMASDVRRDFRDLWDIHFLGHLTRLSYRKPVVVGGDFNGTVSDDDIYSESSHVGADGFPSTEREGLNEILRCGFTDTYRLVHPDEEGKFTWWSQRRYKRRENRGWRLDYFLVSDALRGRVRESTMLTDALGSDHCPIVLEMEEVSSQKEEVRSQKSVVSSRKSDLLNSNFYLLTSKSYSRLWNAVDWPQAEAELARMQMMLAKAAYGRDRRLIALWQKRIVRSPEAKLLAVRHTCATGAGAGVDGIRWDTPRERMQAALSLSPEGYRPMPSRMLLLRSKNGKQRRIHVETYYDRAMQCLYAYALDPVAESWGDRTSFSYRKGRSAFDLNARLIEALSGRGAPRWVFIGDVRKCYERISHRWILSHIPLPDGVLHRFLKAGYVLGGRLYPTDEGVGIGCSLSPIVANMTLDGLPQTLTAPLFRYADDLIVTARTEAEARCAQALAADFLRERGLSLAAEKSRIVDTAHEEFTFLSRTYRRVADRLYARPSDASVERFMTGIRDTVGEHTGSQRSLIEKLNRKIDGWTSYHKVDDEADEAFRRMDVYINALLLKLCQEKHPRMRRETVIRRYWSIDEAGRRRYSPPDRPAVRLKLLADTLTADYRPVRPDANPYIDTGYFESRTRRREMLNVTGICRTVWDRQHGRCHYCGHPLLPDDEKLLVEVAPDRRSRADRMAYVHRRCLEGTMDYIDVPSQPATLDDLRHLLDELENTQNRIEKLKH